jgi:hypothetical protein
VVQGDPTGQRLGLGGGGESVDQDGVVLTEDQGRCHRIPRHRRSEPPRPLAYHCLLRRGEHVDAQRCCHASYFLSLTGGCRTHVRPPYCSGRSGGAGRLAGPARQPFGLYLLPAGSAALMASATRSTWTLLLFGRTQSLE